MSTKLNFGRDVQGFNAYAPYPATDIFTATLASAGNASFTVPSNYSIWIVSFSFQAASDIWVAYGKAGVTASPPAGATFASSNSELTPGSRTLNAGTVVNCYNNGTTNGDVCVVMYAVS